ncbi:MAG: DeoR/GlpR family DNA-binding transcription regulator [Planctomycetota bacterium]
MKREKSRLKKGRPLEKNSRLLLVDVLELLLNRRQEASADKKLTFVEIEMKLNVPRRRLKSILRKISEVSSGITFVSDGILVQRETYYHKHLDLDNDLKDVLADKVVSILPNDVITVACSGGTTVAKCVKRFAERKRYHEFLTNNLGVIDQIGGSREIGTVVLTGGRYDSGVHGCVGDQSIEEFKKARSEAALIGVSGINAKGELFVKHYVEKPVNKQIIKSTTNYIFIVADITKFTKEDSWQWATIDTDILNENERRDLELIIVTNDPVELSDNQKREQAQRVIASLKKIEKVTVEFSELVRKKIRNRL